MLFVDYIKKADHIDTHTHTRDIMIVKDANLNLFRI